MKRIMIVLTAVLLGVAFITTSFAWADAKAYNFSPPGLLKKMHQPLPNGLEKKSDRLPPPFQNFENLLRGNIEGTIVLVKQVSDETWIVVKSGNALKAVKVTGNNTYQNGDVVKVQYEGDLATSIQLVTSTEAIDNDLRYELSVTPKRAVVGNEITFRLGVHNPSQQNISRTFSSSQRFDFIVKRGNTKVWQWSDGEGFLTSIETATFRAGRTTNYTNANKPWEPNKPGEYTVEAYFLGDRTRRLVARESIVVTEQATDLSYILSIDPQTVDRGDEVDFTLFIINDTNKSITKTLSDNNFYDFVVRKENGTRVWRWSDNQNFERGNYSITLNPGDRITKSVTWETRTVGKYKVEAYFLAESNNFVASGQFEVE